MSIDFDSAAIQTQHEEDEYDQEDYAREQEVQNIACHSVRGPSFLSLIFISLCHGYLFGSKYLNT